MENQLLLPQEVAQIAEGVSVEKRTEVEAVLAHVFNGVQKMRDQLDGVVVADENDKVSMKLANTIRLAVRQTRLNAEKQFDAKRAEVQQQMLSYKTEDKLWLRAKQIMQDLTKEIEETAKWKEETAKRFEAEQCELKTQNRMLQVSKFAPEITRPEFEYMSDETFSSFVLSLEKTYNDRIEAERKAEEKRIADEKKAEEKARKEAEEAAEAERKAAEAAELKAKNATDKEKLLAFVEALKWLPLPELQGQAAKDILGEAILNITLVYAAIEKKCAEL